jgi:hypothetical protein
MFTKGDPKGRKFTLLHCWHILKDKPKWVDRRREIGYAKKSGNKKQKTIANSSPASVAAGPVVPFPVDDDSEPPARPDGKKKEKQKLKQCLTIKAMDYLMAKKKEADIEKDSKKEERCKNAFALQEERLKLEKDKFEFQRDLEEERILNLDLTTMTYDLEVVPTLCSMPGTATWQGATGWHRQRGRAQARMEVPGRTRGVQPLAAAALRGITRTRAGEVVDPAGPMRPSRCVRTRGRLLRLGYVAPPRSTPRRG